MSRSSSSETFSKKLRIALRLDLFPSETISTHATTRSPLACRTATVLCLRRKYSKSVSDVTDTLGSASNRSGSPGLDASGQSAPLSFAVCSDKTLGQIQRIVVRSRRNRPRAAILSSRPFCIFDPCRVEVVKKIGVDSSPIVHRHILKLHRRPRKPCSLSAPHCTAFQTVWSIVPLGAPLPITSLGQRPTCFGSCRRIQREHETIP